MNNYDIRMYDIVTTRDVHASRTYFFSYEAHKYRFISHTPLKINFYMSHTECSKYK